MLSSYSKAGNQQETVVIEDIAAVTRHPFRAVAYSHANRGLFVGSETAPIGFTADSASSVFGNSTKAVARNSEWRGEGDDPALARIRNMNGHLSSM